MLWCKSVNLIGSVIVEHIPALIDQARARVDNEK